MAKHLPVLFALLLIFGSFSAFAADSRPQAGTILHEKDTTPYASLDPQKNITDILNTPAEPVEEETTDIYFSADAMENNKDLQTITATGNVNIIRKNLTLVADKVVYNQKDDIVTAVGNVILVEKDGNVVFSDYVELTDKMTQGEMDNVKVIMADKTRVAARKFRRLEGNDKEMEKVVYSPCDVCRDKDPLWQIKAQKVIHDAAGQDVYYNHAFVEIKGVPVFYMPFLSHPDPSVKRRSGFLPPSFGSSSYLGAYLQPKYFWDISDHEDLTFSPYLSTDQGIVWSADYNKYFTRGKLTMSGTAVRDDTYDKQRGNLFVKGRYEINDYWYADTDLNYISDRYYLRDMSLLYRDNAWLTSSARMQGFDNRNYAAVEAYYYKLISLDDRLTEYDKPYVMPWMEYENVSEPGKFGAYTKTTLNFASVLREETVSTQRLTMINSWNLPYTSPYGEKYKLVASLKSDLYYIDSYLNDDGEIYSGAVGRIFPQIGLEWRIPFVRATETSRQIIEPVIVAVAAPNGGNKINKIPNEDSQDVELDDTNILSLDRYAGYDRNDTGSRISYGINWSAYGEKTGRTSMFLAQSYKFEEDQSFSEVDGQDGHLSDYVGRIYANPNEYLDLSYRFRLNRENFDLNYSELSARMGPRMLSLYISYIYLQENESSSLTGYEERKELYTGLNIALSRDWSLNLYNRQDLAYKGGSLEHGADLIYEDECFKFVTTVRKDNSYRWRRHFEHNENYEKSDYEITATFFLKTLGGAGSK